ncbi:MULTISPECIES: quinone-dependent dihydroorotate dehydrogenase [unclassified Kitasatospora]|uniref:quinone-dependent dihydroorotate dehydrogenase n=1 Tax=unclassified Kitasatospora TaxID=2633591 RepID=UPI00070FD990|nr:MULTISPECIES: quinone-dependent dihydroorotate dehydrogenase [unclassified Kitasatospora]KQV22768.1 dihydroorotate dehydrogenase (quinone) [Kitasatospora sp. Root107]KRB61626.1 dihydroorotate dehydrogenase (quinone) [Kitasatospora sp. Root187]
MYKLLFDLVFKKMDPEKAHHLAFFWIRLAASVPGLRQLVKAVLAPRDPALRTAALGLDLPGPFGLGAGFDKNGIGIDGLSMLGFDFVEIGTVTGEPQPGNPAPRLFRLVEDRALINRMGFNNQGSARVAARLKARPHTTSTPVIGVNIGKTKLVEEVDATADYVKSTERLAEYADYLVVNVSSPNTPGLRNLQTVSTLGPLLVDVRRAADRATPHHVPLLVKIAPDLADEDIDEIADMALQIGLDGIIATNTTIGRDGLQESAARIEEIGMGGLSGAPLKARSLEVLQRLRARTEGRLVLVAVGGIETADDAWERIVHGADLVQGYSAFVYQGPFWMRRMHKGLSARLRASGFTSIAEAVGSAKA